MQSASGRTPLERPSRDTRRNLQGRPNKEEADGAQKTTRHWAGKSQHHLTLRQAAEVGMCKGDMIPLMVNGRFPKFGLGPA